MRFQAVAGLYLTAILCSAPALASPTITDAFSPDQGATELVVRTIGEARQSVRVAGYSFTSRPIADALIAARRRGLDVEIVLDEKASHDRGSLAASVFQNGVPTRLNDRYAIMHDKFIVIDGSTVELGSFNYTSAAEHRNAENVLVLHDAPEIAGDYGRQWDRLWREAQ